VFRLELREGYFVIDIERWGQIHAHKGFCGDLHQPLLKSLGVLFAHGQPRSHRVSAMPLQKVSALVQGVVNIKFGDGAAGSLDETALYRADNSGFVIHLRQSSGSQPHHTWVVVR